MNEDQALGMYFLQLLGTQSAKYNDIFNSCKSLFSHDKHHDNNDHNYDTISEETSIDQNVIMPEIYDHLEMVIYNGPPNTIYGKFLGNLSIEKDLCEAVRKCSDNIIKYIKNPSDKVLMAYIDRNYGIESYFKKLINPSKTVISHYIIKHETNAIIKYQHLYSEEELYEMIKIKPCLVSKIIDPTIKMYETAINKDPTMIKYVPKHLQTLKLCEKTVSILFSVSAEMKDQQLLHNIVDAIAYFTEDIVNKIINIKAILDINKIPIQFLNRNNIIEALNINGMRIKNILLILVHNSCLSVSAQEACIIAFNQNIESFKYIDKQLQTEEMLNKIKQEKKYHLVPFAIDYDDLFYEQIVKENVFNIRYVPLHKQTPIMCHYVIKHNYNNLQYCAHFTKEMITEIFASSHLVNVARNDRFKFVNYYDQSTLIRLVSQNPLLIKDLNKKNLTDDVIMVALQSDGYMLKYIENQNDKYVETALNSQPKAIKYVNVPLKDEQN